MARNPVITATISAEDHTRAAIESAAASFRELDKAAKHLRAASELTGANLAGAHNKAIAAAERHVTALHKVSAALKNVGIAAMTYLAYKLPHIAMDAIHDYKPVEKKERAIKGATDYTPAEMDMLRRQRAGMAQKYGEKPEDVLAGQQTFAFRDMSAGVVRALTEQSVIAAKAFGVTIEEGAKMVEGLAFGLGTHFETAADAQKVVPLVNAMAIQQKKGAMSAEDVEAYNKFAVASARAVGMAFDIMEAIPMTLKRESIPGSEAGVFVRSLSANMAAPTKVFTEAALARGVDLSKFVTPGAFNVDNLNNVLGDQFGKELSDGAVKALKARAGKGEFAQQADFVKAAMAAYEKENGKQSAADAKALGDTLSSYHQFNRGKLDVNAMLDWVLSQDYVLHEAAVGSKHAGRLSILSQNRETFEKYRSEIAGAELDLAAKIAAERMQGLSAALDRSAATYADMSNRFVEAASPAIIAFADISTAAMSWASSLDDAAVQTAIAVGGIVSLGGVALSAVAAIEGFMKIVTAAEVIAGGGGKLPAAPAAGGAAVGGAAAGAGVAEGVAGAVGAAGGGIMGALKNGLKGGLIGLPIYVVGREAIEGGTSYVAKHFEGQTDESLAKIRGETSTLSILGRLYDTISGGGYHFTGDSIGAELDRRMKEKGVPEAAFSPSGKQEIQAIVSGEANLVNHVVVEPSPLLLAKVRDEARSVALPLRGNLGSPLAGSNGVGKAATPSGAPAWGASH